MALPAAADAAAAFVVDTDEQVVPADARTYLLQQHRESLEPHGVVRRAIEVAAVDDDPGWPQLLQQTLVGVLERHCRTDTNQKVMPELSFRR